VGGGGTDTLTGDNAGDTFTVTGAGSGTLAGKIGGSFSGIANLTGCSRNDNFFFQNGTSITGNIVGGGGTDSLTGDNNGPTFSVTGAGSGTLSGNVGGSFSGIANLTGGSGNDSFILHPYTTLFRSVGGGGTDTLTGDNTGDTFTVTGAGSGTLASKIGGTFS